MRPRRAPGERAEVARLSRMNRVSAVCLFFGGVLFALGAGLAQFQLGGRTTVNVAYLVGGSLFSIGSFVSIPMAVAIDGGHGPARPGQGGLGRIRISHPPLGVRSAVVMFVGTCLFTVSLVAAFARGLTPRQSNDWVWLPDILGCICFVAAGHMAHRNLGSRSISTHTHQLSKWVVVVGNLVGSYLFFLAGLAAFTRPSTSTEVNTGLVNWGTLVGALFFTVCGVIQTFETPAPTRTAAQHPS